jgi:hypothetical protein
MFDRKAMFTGYVVRRRRQCRNGHEVAHGAVGKMRHGGRALVQVAFAGCHTAVSGLQHNQFPHHGDVLSPFSRGQIDAVQILRQLHAPLGYFVEFEYKGWHGFATGLLGSAPASLACDYLVYAPVIGG